MCLIICLLMGHFKRPLIRFLIVVLMGVIVVINTFYNQIIQIILQYMDYKGLILE